MTRCIHCQKPIDSSWQFCAFCGADNRPPEHRPPIAEHTHDFSKGYHCITCGASYGVEAKKAPKHGLVFRNSNINGLLFVLALLVLFMSLFGFGRRGPIPPPHIQAGLLITGGALGLLAVLVQNRTLVDQDRGHVRRVVGIWPITVVSALPFDAFTGVLAYSQVYSSRYGYRTRFGIRLLRMDGRIMQLQEYSDSGDAYMLGQQLASVMGIPFQNELGIAYPSMWP